MLVEPAADLSKAFHIWIGKSGVKRRVASTGVTIHVLEVNQERKELGGERLEGRYDVSNMDEGQGSKLLHSDTEVCIIKPRLFTWKSSRFDKWK